MNKCRPIVRRSLADLWTSSTLCWRLEAAWFLCRQRLWCYVIILAAAFNIYGLRVVEDRTTCIYSTRFLRKSGLPTCRLPHVRRQLLARQLLRCTGKLLPVYHGVHSYHFQVHVQVQRKRPSHMASYQLLLRKIPLYLLIGSKLACAALVLAL